MIERNRAFVMVAIVLLSIGTLPMILSETSGGEVIEDMIDKESFEKVVQFDITYSIERTLRGGKYFMRPILNEGGVQSGQDGEEIPFVRFVMSSPSKISSYSFSFNNPRFFSMDVVPSMSSAVLGEGSLVDPRWNGNVEHELSTDHSLDLISDGEARLVYRLRINPVSISGSVSLVYTRVTLKMYMELPTKDLQYPDQGHKPTGDIDYLVITSKDLVDSIRPLAEWKTEKGEFAVIITVEEIEGMYSSGDLAYRMRKYVQGMEERFDIDNLLLAGDYSEVPTRNSYSDYPATMYGEPSNFASDGYFACVSTGTSWNSDSDGRIAEGNEIDDPYPDMAVGRLAISNKSIMKEKVLELLSREKSLHYDENLDRTVLIAGDNGQVPGESTDVMDHFWDEYASSTFDGRETVYHDGSGTYPYKTSSMVGLMNEGHNIYGYFSHGEYDGLPALFHNSDVALLNANGSEGLMFAMACVTGWFDKPIGGMLTKSGDCFAEALTETPNKGLVGYIGASRLAMGDSDTVYSGDAPGLEEDFYRAVNKVYNDEIGRTIGDVYLDAVTSFSSSFYPFPNNQNDASKRTFLEYNLLGEPDAPLIINEPTTLLLDYELDLSTKEVAVKVTDDEGNPVKDATVSVTRFGELGVKEKTDENGGSLLKIPPSNGGNVTICAFKEGCIHDNDTFNLPDDLSPETMCSIFPASPDGNNGYYITHPRIVLWGDEPVEVEYRWDQGVTETAQIPPVIIAPEGNNTLYFRVKDEVGHLSDWADLNLKIDTVSPDLKIKTDPAIVEGQIFTSSPLISIGSDEDLDYCHYRIDNGQSRTYNGPFEVEEGEHTIMFKASDLAGNEAEVSMEFIVDMTASVSQLDISHEPDGKNGYYWTIPTIRILSHSSDIGGLEYRWDDEDWTEYTVEIHPTDGVHVLSYRSIDMAGNIETERTWTFKMDQTLPEMAIEVDPPLPDGDNNYYRSIPEITVASNDNVRYILLPEDGRMMDWKNAVDLTGPISIEDGEWELIFKAEDEAGNERTSEPYHFKVDTEAPELLWTMTPPTPLGKNGFFTTPVRVSVSTSSIDDVIQFDMGHGWMEYSQDLELSEGTSTLRLRAFDTAGNVVIEDIGEMKIDTTLPVLDMLEPQHDGIYGKGDIRIVWEGKDDTSDVLYRLRLDDGSLIETGDSTEFLFKDPSNGHHSILVEAEDEAGNIVSKRIDFRVDSITPRVKGISPNGDEVPLNARIRIEFSKSMDLESVSVLINGENANLKWDGSILEATPPWELEYGTVYDVQVRGSDDHGNILEPFEHSFKTFPIVIEEVEEERVEDHSYSILIAGSMISIALMIGIGTAMFMIRKGRK